MRKPIRIRAHHLLCIPRFYRGGYDKKFEQNMKKICSAIRRGPEIKIKVVMETDDLCNKCPHRHENKCTQSRQIGRWVNLQDKKTMKYLKLKPNSVYTAKDVFNISMEKINKKTINTACKNCIFLDNCIRVGINESFRRDLNKN